MFVLAKLMKLQFACRLVTLTIVAGAPGLGPGITELETVVIPISPNAYVEVFRPSSGPCWCRSNLFQVNGLLHLRIANDPSSGHVCMSGTGCQATRRHSTHRSRWRESNPLLNLQRVHRRHGSPDLFVCYVPSAIRGCLRMTVRTKESKIFDSIVISNTIDVV